MLFDKSAFILSLSPSGENEYEWIKSKRVWVRVERQDKANLFSRVGIGVKTVVFTLRKTTGIDLKSAVLYAGRQYFITGVNTDNPVLMTITAADIQPGKAWAFRTTEREGEYKSAVFERELVCAFPAVVTEKYISAKQTDPMLRTETVLVLVTPKPVKLEAHDLISFEPPGGGNAPVYAVKICHVLDEHKNEYEIILKEDE